jgi:pimeloyl-ACP methyl ester carboxylesterase
MLHMRVNGYEMPYISVGQGEPLVCVHGSLGDFRSWFCVLGPLSRDHRVLTPSLRRFFPEPWDGVGDGFTVAQHVADLIAFLEGLGGEINLLGHSRGGHIAFRLAQQRPDLVRRLILAEPGGDLDASLAPDARNVPPPLHSHVAVAAEKIAMGDIDGGLDSFLDATSGQGRWASLPAAARQRRRDNARTLLGQMNEGRQPYSRADAEQIRAPTLFIGGADTPGSLPIVLRALAAHVPGARLELIPKAGHSMFDDDPVRFCAVVLDFLRAP